MSTSLTDINCNCDLLSDQPHHRSGEEQTGRGQVYPVMAVTVTKTRSRFSPLAGYLVLAAMTLVQRFFAGPRRIEIDQEQPAPRSHARRSAPALPLTSPKAW